MLCQHGKLEWFICAGVSKHFERKTYLSANQRFTLPSYIQLTNHLLNAAIHFTFNSSALTFVVADFFLLLCCYSCSCCHQSRATLDYDLSTLLRLHTHSHLYKCIYMCVRCRVPGRLAKYFTCLHLNKARVNTWISCLFATRKRIKRELEKIKIQLAHQRWIFTTLLSFFL